MGLRVEYKKTLIEAVIIDHVHREPTAN